jgi:glyceraldehyde-3-phosphate dehydrogenase (NADP+)
VDALRERVERLVVGNPIDERTDVGPLVSEREAIRVCDWLQEAVRSGARLITGGDRSQAVVSPTLICDVRSEMRIAKDELFGPAVAITPVADVGEAISIAQESRFGLAIGLYTADLDTATRFMREIDYGNIHLNGVPTWRADLMPYGGRKDSGFGREGPRYAIEEMTEMKTIVFH